MNQREEKIADLLAILNNVKQCEISDYDKSLFGHTYDFTSGDMLEVCMALQRKYKVSLSRFMNLVEEYTINNMADALCTLLLAGGIYESSSTR